MLLCVRACFDPFTAHCHHRLAVGTGFAPPDYATGISRVANPWLFDGMDRRAIELWAYCYGTYHPYILQKKLTTTIHS
jgi:hypothetical protein